MPSISDVLRLIESNRYDRAYNILLSSPRILDELKETISNYKDIITRVLVSHVLSTGDIVGSNNRIVNTVFNGRIPEQVMYANTTVFIDNALRMINNGEINNAVEYMRRNMKYISEPDKTIEYILVRAYLDKKITADKIPEIYNEIGLKPPRQLIDTLKAVEQTVELARNYKELVDHIAEEIGEKIKRLVDQPIEKLLEHPEVLELLGLTQRQIEELRALVESGIHDIVSDIHRLLQRIDENNIYRIAELLVKAKEKLDEYRGRLGETYTAYCEALRKLAETVAKPLIYTLISQGRLGEAERIAEKLDKTYGIGAEKIVEQFNKLASITPEKALELVG